MNALNVLQECIHRLEAPVWTAIQAVWSARDLPLLTAPSAFLRQVCKATPPASATQAISEILHRALSAIQLASLVTAR